MTAAYEELQSTPMEGRTFSFANLVQGKSIRPEIYTGEGEEDITDDLDMSDVIQIPSVLSDPNICLVVEISWGGIPSSMATTEEGTNTENTG